MCESLDNWLTPNSLRQPRYPSPPYRRMGNPAKFVEPRLDNRSGILQRGYEPS